MKVSDLQKKLAPALPLMRCPLCGQPFTADGAALRCGGGHAFDLSAKGYVNLAPGHDQAKEKYDAALFASRSQIFQAGFYLPILKVIETMLTKRCEAFTLADIGCGEGYYARVLAERFPKSLCFGVDLSRDGIIQAARGGSAVHWLVADLKRLPFANGALDVMLDVLTPANYQAFSRVIKSDGELIKVIPGDDYLREVRAAVKPLLRSADYHNQRVIDHLEAHARVVERVAVHETFPLSAEQSASFLRMTPMTFSIPTETLESLSLSSITIHMEVLRCQFDGEI